MSRRIALKVSYDGTGLHGFQRQSGTQATVQEWLEKAAGSLFTGPVRVVGAGRTDAGVHAAGQVVHLEGKEAAAPRLPLERLPQAMNSALPPVIRVLASAPAPDGFHACYSAAGKRYIYRIWTGPEPNPFWARYAWCVADGERLDIRRMRAAAEALIGVHDFRSYQASGRTPSSTRREIFRAEWTRLQDWTGILPGSGDGDATSGEGGLWAFRIEGDGFLYRMVRLIVGDLVRIGQGRLPEEIVARRLRGGVDTAARLTAPARGLMLERVFYPPGLDPWQETQGQDGFPDS